jgi:hypothetical protein
MVRNLNQTNRQMHWSHLLSLLIKPQASSLFLSKACCRSLMYQTGESRQFHGEVEGQSHCSVTLCAVWKSLPQSRKQEKIAANVTAHGSHAPAHQGSFPRSCLQGWLFHPATCGSPKCKSISKRGLLLGPWKQSHPASSIAMNEHKKPGQTKGLCKNLQCLIQMCHHTIGEKSQSANHLNKINKITNDPF